MQPLWCRKSGWWVPPEREEEYWLEGAQGASSGACSVLRPCSVVVKGELYDLLSGTFLGWTLFCMWTHQTKKFLESGTRDRWSKCISRPQMEENHSGWTLQSDLDSLPVSFSFLIHKTRPKIPYLSGLGLSNALFPLPVSLSLAPSSNTFTLDHSYLCLRYKGWYHSL